MANLNVVNKAIKTRFPNLDIKLVRGIGYVYFHGDDGFDKVSSLLVHPVCTTTDDMIRLAIEEIHDVYK